MRVGGLGSTVAGAVRRRDLVGWGMALSGAATLVPAIGVTPLLTGGWGWWLRRRVGGVTGDCHGAGVELVETGLLFALLAVGRL